jgi:hypothetical protein
MQEFPTTPFQTKKKPEEYKRLPYLLKFIQDLQPEATDRFLMDDNEFIIFAYSILSRIDLFEQYLMSEQTIRSMLEAQGVFSDKEKEILFIRDISRSSWYQIEQRFSHALMQMTYAKYCEEGKFGELNSVLDVIRLNQKEMYRLLKVRNIPGLISLFESLNKVAEEFSIKVLEMIADSRFTQSEKSEHHQRIKETLDEIKNIVDLVNSHLSYTNAATETTTEISYP